MFWCLVLCFLGDVLSGNQPEGSVHLGVLQEWFGIHWWNSRAVSILFIVVFIMLPLVLFRRVGKFFSKRYVLFLYEFDCLSYIQNWVIIVCVMILSLSSRILSVNSAWICRWIKVQFCNSSFSSCAVCCHQFSDGNSCTCRRENWNPKTAALLGQQCLFFRSLHCCPGYCNSFHISFQW